MPPVNILSTSNPCPFHLYPSCQVVAEQGPHGYGLVAARQFASAWQCPGQELLRLPLTHALCIPDEHASAWFATSHLPSWQHAHHTHLPPALQQLLLNSSIGLSTRLVAWLLWSMQHVDYFRRYRASFLPGQQLLQSMVRASPAHLEALQDAHLRSAVQRMQRQVEEQCALLQQCLPGELGGASHAQLLWAFDLGAPAWHLRRA